MSDTIARMSGRTKECSSWLVDVYSSLYTVLCGCDVLSNLEGRGDVGIILFVVVSCTCYVGDTVDGEYFDELYYYICD